MDNVLKEQVTALDDEIVEKAQRGDRDSQDYILNKYKNLVRKIARPYKIAGADSEDILQEGMIGLYKAIRDFDKTNGTYFHVFAKTCINRQIITAVRTANRKKHNPLNNYISLDVQGSDDGAYHQDILNKVEETKNPETLFLIKEQNENFRSMLKEILSEREMLILNLYLEKHTYAEIAEKVGITDKGISSSIQRIKRKLLTKGANVL